MRANFAVARPAAGTPFTTVVKHEYVHFLLHNRGGQAYPRWFDEGFAEFLSTATVRKGRFKFGEVDKSRADALIYGLWVPFDELIDDRRILHYTNRQRGMFYAQSWALVHYLMMGPDAASFGTMHTRYLQLIEQGRAPVEAFEAAFGKPVGSLATTTRRYMGTMKMFSGRLAKPVTPAQLAVRRMTPDEVAAALGQLAWIAGRMEESLRYYDRSLSLKPDNSDSLVGKADHLKYAKRYADAEDHYKRAIAIRPDSDLHHLDFGEYWLHRADETNAVEDKQRFLSLARREFVAAFKLNDSNPETLAEYGASFLRSGSDPAKGLDTLELANQLLPSHPGIKFRLAQLYLALGRPADARPLLQAVVAWEHGDGATEARKLLEQIDDARPSAEDSGS
jgi:tetratricopeptide (TPR) repeat protein